jgi:hypothetical protein
MLCLKRKKDDFANKAEEEKRIFSLCVRGLKPVEVEKYVYGRRSSLLLLLGRGFCSRQLLILCFCLRGSLPEKKKKKKKKKKQTRRMFLVSKPAVRYRPSLSTFSSSFFCRMLLRGLDIAKGKREK